MRKREVRGKILRERGKEEITVIVIIEKITHKQPTVQIFIHIQNPNKGYKALEALFGTGARESGGTAFEHWTV